jgi:hypothetical protein
LVHSVSHNRVRMTLLTFHQGYYSLYLLYRSI